MRSKQSSRGSAKPMGVIRKAVETIKDTLLAENRGRSSKKPATGTRTSKGAATDAELGLKSPRTRSANRGGTDVIARKTLGDAAVETTKTKTARKPARKARPARATAASRTKATRTTAATKKTPRTTAKRAAGGTRRAAAANARTTTARKPAKRGTARRSARA